MPDAATPSKRARRRLLVLAVGVLALAAYANSIRAGFVWDDRMLILQDPVVHSLRHLKEIFSGDFFARTESPLPYGYYRPVTTLTYILDYALAGTDPVPYHLTNVLLHSLASILALLVLWRLGVSEGVAFVAAALFAVHPIHTESVAWIAGRTDLLAFVLTIGALLAHLAAHPPPGPDPEVSAGPKKKRKRKRAADGTSHHPAAFMVLALAMFGAALLSKEMAAVLPLWIIAVHRLRFGDGWKRSARAAAPYLLVMAGYAVLRFAYADVAMPTAPGQHHLVGAFLTAPITILRYIGWMLLPSGLSAYVQNPYVTSPADPRFFAALAALAVTVFLLVRYGRRHRTTGMLAAMLAVSFLPLLNFIRVASPPDMGDTMAERFCYLPSLPFIALAVVVLSHWHPLRGRSARAGVAVATTGLVAAGLGLTWQRNRDWHDEKTLFEKTVGQVPDAPLPWTRLALAELRAGNLQAAQRASDRASELAPDMSSVLALHATMLVTTGHADEAVPIQERLVSAGGKGQPIALGNLAYLYRVTGRLGQAHDILRRLVATGKAGADVHFNLAEVLRAEGDRDAALREYRVAIGGRGEDARMIGRLASLEAELGNTTAAILDYRRAITQRPQDARLYDELGRTLARSGRLAEAERAFASAGGLGSSVARLELAQILVRQGRTEEARVLLQGLLSATSDPRLRRPAEALMAGLAGPQSVTGTSPAPELNRTAGTGGVR
ncbi:MAG: tetratricopeptide repeat protein [Acidobacteria bacterium]|nr:tetratricopeptide repeat protein [Acidobacteriota bacterium]